MHNSDQGTMQPVSQLRFEPGSATHVSRTCAEWGENRWVVHDSLQPLIQPPIGIVNVCVGSPQRLVPLSQDRKGKHRRVRRQVHRSPFISCVRGRENDPLIAGLTNPRMDGTEQAKGFVEYGPD
jgi:hypothetical protein